MFVRVRQLREHGRRRKDRELDTDAGMTGRLSGFVIGGSPVLHLYTWGPPAVAADDVFLPLYEPGIIGLRDVRMLVRGWQRDSADEALAATMLQEWTIEFLPEEPPVMQGVLYRAG